jgi:hypothetical protein
LTVVVGDVLIRIQIRQLKNIIMTNEHDQSYKDSKYFINDKVYNCPFCKRRNVSYSIIDHGFYNSSNDKKVFFYIAVCDDEDCGNRSFHISKYDLALYPISQAHYSERRFVFPPKKLEVDPYKKGSEKKVDIFDGDNNPIEDLDELFYYSDPSSFFTIDERVPNKIREPLSESYNALKNNLITGASACLRKTIYKLLQNEKIPDTKDDGRFYTHDERIELLKKEYTDIESELLDELKVIHILTSQELHENDWEDFNSHKIRFLIEVIKEVLTNMYVLPNEKYKRRQHLNALKAKSTQKSKSKK